jgi:hypothetical protein
MNEDGDETVGAFEGELQEVGHGRQQFGQLLLELLLQHRAHLAGLVGVPHVRLLEQRLDAQPHVLDHPRQAPHRFVGLGEQSGNREHEDDHRDGRDARQGRENRDGARIEFPPDQGDAPQHRGDPSFEAIQRRVEEIGDGEGGEKWGQTREHPREDVERGDEAEQAKHGAQPGRRVPRRHAASPRGGSTKRFDDAR